MGASSCQDEWGKWSQTMLRVKERENIYTVSNNSKFVSRRKARLFPALNTVYICLYTVALWVRLA